jgi:hypothetical protein
MILQLDDVRLARGVRYRPATRAELYAQARQLGLASRSRMRKTELARAVARERRRSAPAAAGRAWRAHFAEVTGGPAGPLAAVPALLSRPSRLGRTGGWTAGVMVAVRRPRWVERVALPVAVMVLAGVFGAATPLLMAGGAPEGVAATDVAAPIRASHSSPEPRGPAHWRAIVDASTPPRSTQPLPGAAPVAEDGATPIGLRGPVAAVQEESPSSPSAEDGPAAPSGSPAPPPSPGGDPDAGEPAPPPAAAPPPGPPVDEAPGEDEQSGAKVTLCHKAGSINQKTIVVGEGAVDEHLAHGDTMGACP